MKKLKFLLLIITTAILFYNCESNTEDLISEPVSDPQEDSVGLKSVIRRNLYF